MNLLKEITERDLGLKPRRIGAYRVRRAARAVLFNRNGDVALLFASRDHYHKLPGGGVEEWESVEAALRREVKEETGCIIATPRELGLVLEFRNKVKLLAISYCFVAYAKSEGTSIMTASERKAGFKLVWMPLDRAISLMKTEGAAPKMPYMGKFMHARELLILEEARKRQKA